MHKKKKSASIINKIMMINIRFDNAVYYVHRYMFTCFQVKQFANAQFTAAQYINYLLLFNARVHILNLTLLINLVINQVSINIL